MKDNLKMSLLDSWANWQPDSPPFILDGDREMLESQQSMKHIITYRSWQEAFLAPYFCAPGDKKLHLGLLPQPFFGDVRNATIYILLLNPGLGPSDYFGEYEVPQYRAALLANLQQHSQSAFPFLFLDPQFSWHGGFNWWHGKLARVIQCLAEARGISFAEARSYLASIIASVELLPYHSPAFRDAGNWRQKLESVRLVCAFAKEFIFPRVESGNAIVIITRNVGVWNLPKHQGVITYTAGQARGAQLTPDSPGGKAILKHLGVLE